MKTMTMLKRRDGVGLDLSPRVLFAAMASGDLYAECKLVSYTAPSPKALLRAVRDSGPAAADEVCIPLGLAQTEQHARLSLLHRVLKVTRPGERERNEDGIIEIPVPAVWIEARGAGTVWRVEGENVRAEATHSYTPSYGLLEKWYGESPLWKSGHVPDWERILAPFLRMSSARRENNILSFLLRSARATTFSTRTPRLQLSSLQEAATHLPLPACTLLASWEALATADDDFLLNFSPCVRETLFAEGHAGSVWLNDATGNVDVHVLPGEECPQFAYLCVGAAALGEHHVSDDWHADMLHQTAEPERHGFALVRNVATVLYAAGAVSLNVEAAQQG